MPTYDTEAKQWSNLQKSGKHLAHDLLEKPAIYSRLGDVHGKRVLCIGCGSGEECQYIFDQGATKVVGIDSSKGLIEQAKYQYSEVEFYHMSAERLDFPSDSFDLVFSSLTFHYIEDWNSMLAKIYKILAPGGKLLFSTHHPVKWGAQTTRTQDKNEFLLGYQKSKKTDDFEVYGDYLTPRPIKDTLLGKIDITHYHKPLSHTVQAIISCGFTITWMDEPKPLETTKNSHRDFYEAYSKIPLFVIFEAVRQVEKM